MGQDSHPDLSYQPAGGTETPDLAELIDVDEATRRAGVSRSSIQRWIRAGTLRAWKLGGRLRVLPADLQALLVPAGPPPRPEPRVTRGQEKASTRRILDRIFPHRSKG